MQMSAPVRVRTAVRRTVAMAVVGLALSACNGVRTPAQPQVDSSVAATSASPTLPPAEIAMSVDGKKDVAPDAAVTVTAENGELVQVQLLGPDKKVVPGKVTKGAWAPGEANRFTPDATYTWAATAKNADGQVSRQSGTFHTLKPRVIATYTVTPDGETVGVGMPVVVRFDSPVNTPDMRADVERRMKIKTVPAQKGSWGWVDSTQLMWRPDRYWKAGTKVSVQAPLRGVQTGEDKWVGEDKGAAFTISQRARVARVDLANHRMTVRENGKVVAEYPISAGRAEGTWETRSGTKVITEKHAEYTMDAGTLGLDEKDPNYYKTTVKYAMRVTNTGEFFHSAPWSVWAQGSENVSHGCVNLGPRNAREYFEESQIGDVAEFVGSDRRMKPGDGLSVWLFDSKEWHARSAL